MHLENVPIAVIAAWLGHASSAFTMATYVHSQETALAEAAQTLSRAMTNSEEERRTPSRGVLQYRTERRANGYPSKLIAKTGDCGIRAARAQFSATCDNP